MQKTKGKKESKEKKEQDALLKSFLGTVHHFFGSWDTVFGSVFDVRKKHLIKYSVAELLCTGVLMFVFHLKSRRQIAYKLGKNEMSEEKFKELLGMGKVPHGDTLNYSYKNISVEETQEVVSCMVEKLIRKKVLDHWRFYGYFLIAMDGTGQVTFRERHCEHCLTKKLRNGKILYYTENGHRFTFSNV